MKKFVSISFGYAILAMAGGVFYREFTKWNHFDGVTALGKVHVHLFVFGMLFFLIVGLINNKYNLKEEKTYKPFMWLFNIGLIMSVIMLLVRGIFEVLGSSLTSGMNGAISGIAGLSHIILATGLVLFFITLLKSIKKTE